MRLAVILRFGATAFSMALSGCASDERGLGLPRSSAMSPLKMNSDQLVGRWGLGAYHRETDRARTIPQAKAQCSNAYVAAGPMAG